MATLLLPMCSGWQCWTAVGMGGATADGGGGHAQRETGGGDGDCLQCCNAGEVSGANTATSTCKNSSTIFNHFKPVENSSAPVY